MWYTIYMKKIIVVSDSHGNKQGIDQIFQKEEFDYFLFLGDCLGDLGTYAHLENMLAVRGNCDFFSSAPSYGILQVEGVKVFYCHGHEYSVKSGLGGVVNAGKCIDADLVLFGHTHRFLHEVVDNMHVVNCPALGRVRGGEGAYMEILVDNKKISIFKKEI